MPSTEFHPELSRVARFAPQSLVGPRSLRVIRALSGLQRGRSHGDVQKYMDANPGVESDINGIRQPVTDLQNRCDYHPGQ